MKLWPKVITVFFLIFLLVLAAMYIFFVNEGKDIFVAKLEKITERKVTLGSFKVVLPLAVKIKDLNIEGMGKVDSVSISPSVLGFYMGSLAFNSIKVVNPQLTFERAAAVKEEALNTKGEPVAASSGENTDTADSSLQVSPSAELSHKEREQVHLIIKHAEIKGGRLNFIDYKMAENGIKITVEDIAFNLSNLYLYPRSVITNFELKGSIPWHKEAEKGTVKLEGWVNFFKKDMRARLEINGIDAVYLYPYYASFIDLEKARIERAKLDFSTDVNGLNNNVSANSHLELNEVVFKQRSPSEQKDREERVAAAVINVFKTMDQGKIVLDFKVNTKMDAPEFGFDNIRLAFEEKLMRGLKSGKVDVEDIVTLPTKFLQGTVKGATDLSKAVIDGTFAVGVELKKAVAGAFKRE